MRRFFVIFESLFHSAFWNFLFIRHDSEIPSPPPLSLPLECTSAVLLTIEDIARVVSSIDLYITRLPLCIFFYDCSIIFYISSCVLQLCLSHVLFCRAGADTL